MFWAWAILRIEVHFEDCRFDLQIWSKKDEQDRRLNCVRIVFSSPAHADIGTKISTVGDWAIYRQLDPMTDAPSCVGTYKNDISIQLTSDSFAFSLAGRGGVSGYQLRWDDAAASGMKLPTDTEKEVSAFILSDERFSPVLSSKRLRVQVLTVLSTIVNFDVNLSTAKQAIAVLSGPQCKRS
jgi:hypothetical protein